MRTVLLVEDDNLVAYAIEHALAREKVECLRVASIAEALEALSRRGFEVALVDLGLPDGDGIALLPALLKAEPAVRIIVLSGRDDVREAVRALKGGAAEYIVKPFERDELVIAVTRGFQEAQLRRENEAAKRQWTTQEGIVLGESQTWTQAMEHLHAAAGSPRAPVLILGESGCGKEVAATLVHKWSPRAQGPFVAVNAACLPASTLDSELFGHEAGAFTDAKGMRRGLFELAREGTLFLDEIGELPLEVQPKLLRVLEGAPFRRLGGEREIRTDVRVIAATHRPLDRMVKEGRFREDLYWRLKVLAVRLPPLRERRADIRSLALHFLQHFSQSKRRLDEPMSSEAMERIESYQWPGNVRELRNVVERAVVLSRGGRIEVEHLPEEIRLIGAGDVVRSSSHFRDVTLSDVVRTHVLDAWKAHGGNVTQVAKALGISRVALRRHLTEYGVYGREREVS